MATLIRIAVILWATASAMGGAPNNPYASPDVFVAAVTKAAEENATQGNPPRVELAVLEVLRGQFTGRAISAVWHAPPHDIDTTGRKKELKRWMATPMKAPEVGQKFIVYGTRVQAADGEVFHVRGDAIKPWSDENRARVVDMIADDARAAQQAAQRHAAEVAALAADQRKWRDAMTDAKIRAAAAHADLVVVARITSELFGKPERLYLKVDEVLKTPANAPSIKLVFLPVTGDVHRLLDRSTSYLLLLKGPGKADPSGFFACEPVADTDGIVIADAAALQSARAATGGATTRPAQ